MNVCNRGLRWVQVVPEPVQQWQAFDCKDRLGRDTTENVLQKFYSDPQRFAYSFQHYVLVSRMAEVGAPAPAAGSVLPTRSRADRPRCGTLDGRTLVLAVC